MGIIDLSIIRRFNRRRYGYTVAGGKATTTIAAEDLNSRSTERLREWQPLTDAVMKCNKGSVKL